MVLFDFTLEISGPNNTELVKKVTAESKEDAVDKVGQELVNRGSVSSVSKFKTSYNITQTKYEFSTVPWDDDLTGDLESLDGVSFVRYSDPYTGAYEPPTFYLGVSPDGKIESVKDAVKEYFDGFDISVENGNVVIRFASPLKN